MVIKLTAASSDALAKVDGMKQWRVGPTMVRGSNRALDELPAAVQPGNKKRKTTPSAKKAAKENKDTKKPKKALPEKLDLGLDDFHRKSKTRAASVVSFLEELLRIDEEAFGSIPLFNKDGILRMSMDGAQHVKLQEMLENADECFLDMCLDENIRWPQMLVDIQKRSTNGSMTQRNRSFCSRGVVQLVLYTASSEVQACPASQELWQARVQTDAECKGQVAGGPSQTQGHDFPRQRLVQVCAEEEGHHHRDREACSC